LCQPLERWQEGLDAAVIGNAAVIERNVGINAKEDHTTVKVEGFGE
jgi:hypothetical protein